MDTEEIVATFRGLSDALEMTEDAIVVAKQGLLQNPTKEVRRALDADILELEAKRAKISAKMIALGRGEPSVKKPTDAQIAEIATLVGEVDQLTRASAAASQALAITGRVLDLISDVKFS